MRIGVDLTSLWRPATGAENVAIEMVRALLQTDRHNEYTLFFSQSTHPAFNEFAGQYKVVVAPWCNEVLVKHAWLPRSAAFGNLDYMHFPVFPPPWTLPCISGWTLPDATPWLYPETMKLKSRLYFGILGKRSVKTTSLWITDTEASRRDLIHCVKVPKDRVHVIYPGRKLVFQRCLPPSEADRVVARYGVPRNFILFVGTLEPKKNLSRILSAFRVLKTSYQFQPALVIVGRKGWLYEPVIADIEQGGLAGQVYVTGYVSDEDLLVLYNMARLLVFPSIYEGFGLPAIEAMACGCPVVTSNRGALLEVTADAALHCDPENVMSIADAVWRTHTDDALRRELITKGLRRVNLFSWKKYAERFLELVMQTAKESSRTPCGKLGPAPVSR